MAGMRSHPASPSTQSSTRTIALRALLGAISLATATVACADDDGEWIDAQLRKWQVPGVAIAIVRPGQAPMLLARGLCDIEKQVPCTADSPFSMGSTTKFVTGLLAATLAAEKKLSLDEPLINRWPEFRLSDPRWTEITLKDLLSQQSGLGSVDWPYFWDDTLTRQDYVARAAFFPMAKPFRSGWRYANANFVIAGAYLERVSGQSWEALVRERLLLPLRMTHSGFDSPAGKTAGYVRDGNGAFVRVPHINTPAIGPAGSLVSTARDFSSLLQTVLDSGKWQGQQVLPASAVSAAIAPVIGLSYDRRSYGPPGGYGLGVFLASYRNSTILQHSGGYGGYSTHFALLPQQKIGVVVLANRTRSEFPHALALGLIDRVLGMSGDEPLARWLEPATRKAPITAAASAPGPTRPLPAYAGKFRNPAWGVFEVYRAQGKLNIRYGPFEAPLDHYRYDNFSFESAPGWERLRLRFEADAEGNIGGFSMDDEENAQLQKFERVAP